MINEIPHAEKKMCAGDSRLSTQTCLLAILVSHAYGKINKNGLVYVFLGSDIVLHHLGDPLLSIRPMLGAPYLETEGTVHVVFVGSYGLCHVCSWQGENPSNTAICTCKYSLYPFDSTNMVSHIWEGNI